MEHTYKLKRVVDGVLTTDYARFSCPDHCDLIRILHMVGLEYCQSTKQGRDLYERENGLTLAQIMAFVTPEMLEKHDIRMTWLSDEATCAGESKIIGPYELDIFIKGQQDKEDDLRRLYNYVRSIARRLDIQRDNGHPEIMTWNGEQLATRAFIWGKQFLAGSEKSFDRFFNRKMAGMGDGKGLPRPVNT